MSFLSMSQSPSTSSSIIAMIDLSYGPWALKLRTLDDNLHGRALLPSLKSQSVVQSMMTSRNILLLAYFKDYEPMPNI